MGRILYNFPNVMKTVFITVRIMSKFPINWAFEEICPGIAPKMKTIFISKINF
jgi:hypothetical protein